MNNNFLRALARVILLGLTTLGLSAAAFAQVALAVTVAPPILPVYAQPMAPGPGFIWTPGYWAWGVNGYFWVPGTWVNAPFVGALWTPGYWGWRGGTYVWNAGYWGPRIGFYGGVNYGYGYGGVGYQGGYWSNGAFRYNTQVNNINVADIHHTYAKTVIETGNASRVSYEGGAGGIAAQPTAEERLAELDNHRVATPRQAQHEQAASTNRAQLASVNHGSPAVAATVRPAVFKDHASSGAAGTTHAGPNSMVATSHAKGAPAAEAGNPHAAGTAHHAQHQPHAQGEAQVGHSGNNGGAHTQ
jgi:hypothetical protein